MAPRGIRVDALRELADRRVALPKALADVTEPINTLWYGDGGMGKTTHLCSVANLGKLWVCSAENGVKARALRERGIPVENIEIFPDPDSGEELTYDSLEKEFFRLRDALNEDPGSYIGAGFDSITEVQQVLRDQSVRESVARKASVGQERSRWITDQDNWTQINGQVRQLLRDFSKLPCHFGATALQRREQDRDGAVTYQPGVTPSLQTDIYLWFDVICHCTVEVVDGEEEYRGLFRPVGKFRGKDRFNAIPRHLIDPTYDRCIQYIDRELTAEDDPVMVAARERHKREEAAKGAADKQDQQQRSTPTRRAA